MNEGAKTILIIDDNQEITDGYSMILPRYGYAVETAGNAVDGFSLLKKKRYDLLLLDMRLPDSSGEEIFIELQANPKYRLNRETPVAIFTGFPEDDTRRRLLDLGVSAYLVKPFDPMALASVLDNLIETERRRKISLSLRRQLEELHRFNYLVFNALPSGLIVLDVKNKVVLANKMAHNILERDFESIKAMPLANVLGQQNLDYVIAQTDGDLNDSREMEIDLGDHTISVGFTISSLTNREGENIGRVLIFRDITALKQMSDESKRVERLASLGTLASGIAHEIKNPLAGIKAMAQLIEDSAKEDSRTLSFSKRIIGQVDRLNQLLNGFFSIARQQKSIRHIFPLDNVLRDVMPLIGGAAKKKEIEIIVDTPENVEIFGRPEQIQQVLLNLTLNALDAVPLHSTIRVEASEPIERSSRQPIFGEERAPDKLVTQPPNSLVIRVVDNGPGIPEDLMSRIFDPFFTTKEQGTGLGLFIVHQLVQDELGGRIDVISSPGETVFAVILPTMPVQTGSLIIEEPPPLDLPGAPGFKPMD